MSLLSRILFLLPILLLSSHACSARRLRPANDHNENCIRFLTEDEDYHVDFNKASTVLNELSASQEISEENQEAMQGDKNKLEVTFSSARSLLGSKKAVESEENEAVEEVEVMDYAQPHRKPPIHNEKS